MEQTGLFAAGTICCSASGSSMKARVGRAGCGKIAEAAAQGIGGTARSAAGRSRRPGAAVEVVGSRIAAVGR